MNRKKFFLLAGVVATFAMFPAVTGCSSKELNNSVSNLNQNMVAVLNENLTADRADRFGLDRDEMITGYQFLGVGVEKVAFDYGIDMYGLSSFETEKSTAYAVAHFDVPSSEFHDIDSKSSTKDVIDKLSDIIKKYAISNFEITKVSNLQAINKNVVSNCPIPLDGFKVQDSIVYNVTKPTFDTENGTVTFYADTFMELKQYDFSIGVGPGLGITGSNGAGLGIGIGVSGISSNMNIIQKDKITLKLSKEEIEEISGDYMKVYEKFVDMAINDKDNVMTEIASSRIAGYIDKSMIDEINFKNVEQELGK